MLPDLRDLGQRIAILGPSNSGKSTFALHLNKKLGFPVLHLDQITHEPGTDWTRLEDAKWLHLHDAFLQQDKWIIDGNYSVCMEQRFARATSVIWLDPPLAGCVFRYILRCLKRDPARPGHLSGAKKEFNFHLIKFTLVNYPENRKKYRRILAGFPDLKIFVFKSMLSLPS